MKKILITTIFAFTYCLLLRADAMVVMDYQGNTVVNSARVERNLLINSDDDLEYDIALRPLDETLTSADGKVSIPLENVYINNTREDIYFKYNEYSNVFKRLRMNGIPKHLTAVIRDYGMVPAGIYNLNFEIQAMDSNTHNIESMSTFMLQFMVMPTQELSFHGEEAVINVNAGDVFTKNKKITTDTNPMLHINSNCDWSLFVNTDKLGDSVGNYFIRTVSASNQVSERLQERIQLYPDKEIMIAKGKAPSNNEYITLELAVEGKDGSILKAGNYYNNLRFILREDKGR